MFRPGSDDEADSIDAQRAVLDEALDKFVERNAIHQDLWREDSVVGMAQAIKSKSFRVFGQASIMTSAAEPDVVDQIVDDALDGINYLVFLIRKVRGG